MNNFTRGSQWEKWDLHIHTPASICQKYGGVEKWEKFIEALERLPADVKVIGITDYYFIDGYEKVMEYKRKGRLNNIDKIFPILEFRIDTFGSGNENNLQKINLHILFDLNEENLQSEIAKVKTEFILQIPITKLEKHKTKMLSKENLTSEAGDLQKGFSDLIPPTDKVFDLLSSSTWKNKVFLFIGYKEWSNLDKNNQLKPIKDDIYQKVSAFFTSNEKNLNKSKSWLDEYGDKPLLHSGDIHDFEFLDTANTKDSKYVESVNYKCHTWIKANPTFEGLRQIIFEPSRVRIQQDKPELKKDSDVIESVRFESKNKLFISEQIYLNQNLNVIIGGKSTGKSLLLYSIAKVFDKHREDINYKHECKLIVKYKDGQEYSLNNKPQRLIEYISQGYLQNLVIDDDSSHNEFTKLINDSLKENENYLKLSNDFNAKNTELKSTINLEINNFLSKKNDIKEKTEGFKKLGDIEAKKSELQINLDSIEKIKSESTLTDAEKLEFHSLQSIKSDLTSKGKSKRQVETYLLELRELLVQENLKNSLEQKKNSFSQNLLTTDESLINSISDDLKVIIIEFHSKIESTVENFDIKIKTDLDQLKLEYQENDKKLKIFQDKLSEYGKINKLEEENENYKTEILAIESAKFELENLKKELDSIKSNIFNSYQEFISNHINFIEEVNQNHSSTLSDVKVTSYINFDSKSFYEKYTEKYNLQGSQNNEFSLKDYIFNISKHYEEICKIFEKIILRQDIQFKRGVALKEVFDALFDTSYLSYKFNLTQGNDDILKMSQGKKGIVLLKLYLSQKNVKHPILIDQPEDNLDNRTIYSELNDFIKRKKIDRQIIMVTHNANLVVTTDAEQVIVANQAGEDGKGKKEFKFEYKTGALEDTKPKNEKIQGVLYQQGIREHVCEILEGGKDAFKKREEKYGF